MNLEKSLNRIIELLSIFRYELEHKNAAGLFDFNSLAEDVLLPIFKDAFGHYFLRNLNKERRNFAGIDLGDPQDRVAFQITSDPSLSKVRETLLKVVQHRHYLTYQTIYIYILTKKQGKYNKKSLQEITKDYFNFDPDLHILDSENLINHLRALEYDKISNIEQTLEIHFSNPKKYFVRQDANQKLETLTLNILPIQFPHKLFIGTTNYVREDVIQQARRSQVKISSRCSQRRIVWEALTQQGLNFSSGWVVRSNQLITFHSLRDESLPLATLIDPTTVEEQEVESYISDGKGGIHLDRVNIFKELLRTTLQEQLRHRGIIWQHEQKLFIFKPVDNESNEKEKPVQSVRKEAWSKGKKEGRIVYQILMREDNPEKVKFHEHLAFQVGFDLYNSKWYLAIKPDFFCSRNGYQKSGHHQYRVSYLKRQDHNPDVVTDLLFITEILKKDQTKVMMKQDFPTTIHLGDLIRLDGAPPIPDHDWQRQDEKRKRKAFEAKPKLPLFKDL